MRKIRRIARYRKAQVFALDGDSEGTDIWIDYLTQDHQHRFAHIDSKEFTEDYFDQMIGVIEESIRWNTSLSIIVESRTLTFEDGETQDRDYVIGVDSY